MQLGRYQISTLRPSPIHSINFSVDGRFFAVASQTGYEVWRTCPLALVKRKVLAGTLATALLLPGSGLLVLQGGGRAPVYSPNKAVIYHDALGIAAGELEFGQRIRGITVRRGMICIALSRKILAFVYGTGDGDVKGKRRAKEGQPKGFWMKKVGEWETAKNDSGLMAMSTAPASTLLALPGRQPGHVQLIALLPCPGPSSAGTASSSSPTHSHTAFRSPIILAHTHALSTLTCTSNGSHILTTSERGTLLRVWHTARGRLERELRRGVDRAEMWGADAEPMLDGSPGSARVVGWSDKGTVHVWPAPEMPSSSRSSTPTQPSLTHLISRNLPLPLPKYFSSLPSIAQYYLPRKNPHAFKSVVRAAAGKAGVPSDADADWAERFVVGWVQVEVEVEDPPQFSDNKVPATGKREETTSMGSEAPSSRTATPTSAVHSHRRQTSLSGSHSRSSSSRAAPWTKEPRVRATVPEKRSVMENQLVAITFSGDWYRLRIPNNKRSDEGDTDGTGNHHKCELVEYRRLGVVGGGW